MPVATSDTTPVLIIEASPDMTTAVATLLPLPT